jgi:hypothetical protein
MTRSAEASHRVSRIVLEEDRNLYTVIAWLEDALHLALCDVGDSDAMGSGLDIPQPALFLQWLVADRWPSGIEAPRRLLAYCNRWTLKVTEDPAGPSPTAGLRLGGVELVVTGEHVYVHEGPWGGQLFTYRIDGWRELVLRLVQDRCEGRNAWKRVNEELRGAGLSGREKWRGYV